MYNLNRLKSELFFFLFLLQYQTVGDSRDNVPDPHKSSIWNNRCPKKMCTRIFLSLVKLQTGVIFSKSLSTIQTVVFFFVDRLVSSRSSSDCFFLALFGENFTWREAKLEQLKTGRGRASCLRTGSLWIVIWFGLNSSQQCWNPRVIVPPGGCESLAKLCWLWSGSVHTCGGDE